MDFMSVVWFAVSNPLTVIGVVSLVAYAIRQKINGEEL